MNRGERHHGHLGDARHFWLNVLRFIPWSGCLIFFVGSSRQRLFAESQSATLRFTLQRICSDETRERTPAMELVVIVRGGCVRAIRVRRPEEAPVWSREAAAQAGLLAVRRLPMISTLLRTAIVSGLWPPAVRSKQAAGSAASATVNRRVRSADRFPRVPRDPYRSVRLPPIRVRALQGSRRRDTASSGGCMADMATSPP